MTAYVPDGERARWARSHVATLPGTRLGVRYSAARAVGTPRMPAGGKCPHCGERSLYRELVDDAIACLCGWRTYY